MPKSYLDNNIARNLTNMPLNELRQLWADAWGLQPHRRISRPMLIKSLLFKVGQEEAHRFSLDQQAQLDQLIKAYKRNPRIFDVTAGNNIKAGTRIVREWNGERHSILAKDVGFEYRGLIYKSLSQIATEITGTRWNGWTFFGLKKNSNSRGGED